MVTSGSEFAGLPEACRGVAHGPLLSMQGWPKVVPAAPAASSSVHIAGKVPS